MQSVEPLLIGRDDLKYRPIIWKELRHGRLKRGEERRHLVSPLTVGFIVLAALLLGPVIVSLTRLGQSPEPVGSEPVPHLLAWYDFPSLILAADAAIAFAMMALQWRIMSTLLEKLTNAESLMVDDCKHFDIQRGVNLAEQRLDRLRSPLFKALLFLVTLACATVLYREIAASDGFYGFLLPDSLQGQSELGEQPLAEAWHREARDGWWAAGRLGAVVWVFAFGAGLALTSIHILSGFIFFRLARAVARVATFGLNINNPDGHFGRRPLRDLLLSFYVGFLAYAVTTLVIVVMLRGRLPAVILLGAIPFLALNPFFIYWPAVTLHRHARVSVIAHSDALVAKLERVGDDPAARETIQVQLDRLHRIPSAVFRWPGLVAAIVAYAIPATLSLARAFTDEWLR